MIYTTKDNTEILLHPSNVYLDAIDYKIEDSFCVTFLYDGAVFIPHLQIYPVRDTYYSSTISRANLIKWLSQVENLKAHILEITDYLNSISKSLENIDNRFVI